MQKRLILQYPNSLDGCPEAADVNCSNLQQFSLLEPWVRLCQSFRKALLVPHSNSYPTQLERSGPIKNSMGPGAAQANTFGRSTSLQTKGLLHGQLSAKKAADIISDQGALTVRTSPRSLKRWSLTA